MIKLGIINRFDLTFVIQQTFATIHIMKFGIKRYNFKK